ncbi:MAG: hypothetical protein CM1200mP10_18650 [Candidatus Neomarinimicrobiota bacterium]|nr:MAG: hypothetical protein CM1200mP10_18650 [Candidatus Neomarinimicrobiota bacterium]
MVRNGAMAIMKEMLMLKDSILVPILGCWWSRDCRPYSFSCSPRWNGDTNFMPVIGKTKVQVQGLQETYDELKPL